MIVVEKISSFLYVEGGNYHSPSEKTLRLIDDVKDQRRATFVRVYSDNVGHILLTLLII